MNELVDNSMNFFILEINRSKYWTIRSFKYVEDLGYLAFHFKVNLMGFLPRSEWMEKLIL